MFEISIGEVYESNTTAKWKEKEIWDKNDKKVITIIVKGI